MKNTTDLQETVQLLQERLVRRDEIQQEIDQLRSIIGSGGEVTVRRGRKPGRKAKTETAEAATVAPTNGRRGPKPKTTNGRRGRAPKGKLSCPQAIEAVLKKNAKGLKLVDLTKLVLKAGYKTESKNPANVVYQALYSMIESGAAERDDDHKYHLTKKAA